MCFIFEHRSSMSKNFYNHHHDHFGLDVTRISYMLRRNEERLSGSSNHSAQFLDLAVCA